MTWCNKLLQSIQFTELLELLNETGVVLWVDAADLRNSIFLNPVEPFVQPATFIILLDIIFVLSLGSSDAGEIGIPAHDVYYASAG